MDISKDLRKLDTRAKGKKIDQSSMIYGKISPQASELENAVLGAIMLEPQKLTDVLEIINSSECFYGNANRLIYDVILFMFKNGNRIDFLTVCEELRKRDELEMVGGSYYVTSLTRDVVSSANVEEHARIVMEKYIMRELIRISGETINDAYENGSDVFDLLDKAEEGLYDITKNHLRKNVLNISQVLTKTLEEIQAQVNRKADLTGVPTGFKPLNQITSGWQKTDLIILAARPAVRKTAFALTLAMNAAVSASNCLLSLCSSSHFKLVLSLFLCHFSHKLITVCKWLPPYFFAKFCFKFCVKSSCSNSFFNKPTTCVNEGCIWCASKLYLALTACFAALKFLLKKENNLPSYLLIISKAF